MAFLQLLFFSILSLSSLNPCMAIVDDSLQLNDDVLGLIVFKLDIHDPSSLLASWTEDDNSPCTWNFIHCDTTGRVTEISLDGLGLSGKLGRGLEKLQHLKVLSLSNNNFTGPITPEISHITSLEKLNLSHNSFSGRFELPFSTINFLDLSHNSLSGPISDDLFSSCTSLHYLSLSGNLLEGSLPSSLYKCSFLNVLDLSSNHFSGNPNFETGFWSLTRLRALDLSNNVFSGSVPVGVSAIHNLKELRLHENQFFGPLPSDIGLCPHLVNLDFSRNRFTGPIPESLSRLNSLTHLNIASNLISDDFPKWIGDLYSLEYLDFSGNVVTGNLPESIGDLSSLSYLSLSDNKMTGNIPMKLIYAAKLSVIRLSRNAFNGSIPEGLFDLGLQEVDFSGNRFTGSIPKASRNTFGSLRSLDLSRNAFTGDIPAEMGLLSNLKYLNLSWNSFDSKIPSELGYFENLRVLDLRNSALNGPIPADICDSGTIGILQLDGNNLTGAIPDEIGNCSSLYLLSLSHNSLSGPIPSSLSMLNKLKILNLEFNKLTGELPPELGKLENLLAVNISFNQLTGRLPSGGIFQNLDQSSMQGNLGICSPLLKGPCKMNVPKPLVLDPYAYGNQMNGHNRSSEPVRFQHHRFLSVSAIIAISAAVFIAVGVLVISLVNISARRRLAFVDNALESMCSGSSRSVGLGVGPSMGKLVMFDSKSTHEWICNPETILNKASEIGGGMFGTVYKASFGGNMVAIKKLISSSIIQYPEDFDREVRVLGKALHPNLMPIKGYYWTPQLQLLVSDFAPNGSLHAILHEQLPSTPSLPWATRFKIMLGTAKGLAHLHHSFRPPIIHYNLKPSNILLDENYNPKISDFGLARLLTKLDKHVMINRFQSAPGYVAPELACQSLRVNEKCDIYGIGIVILELVTGKRAMEYGEDNVVILCDHVRVLLEEGNGLDCVDSSMKEYPEDEVLPALKLALVCTMQIPSSRPSMAEVVHTLQVIKTPVPQRMEIF